MKQAGPYRSIRTAAVLTVLMCASIGVMRGQQTPPAAPAPNWNVGPVTFSGLIDAYYSFNANHPASRNNIYRNFDVKANQFSLNMAKLTLEHNPEPIGFKLDVGFGRAFEIFHATDPASSDLMRHLVQAYVSFKPANAGGLQIDFGKFYTSAGAELTETNLNWNYSRALLYANGPYYHFGMRATKPLTESFSAGFQLVNGWNNVEDNNSGKTMGFTTGYVKKTFSWFNNYYTGPEKTDLNEGWRHFYDTVLLLTPHSKANFYVNFDYGTEKLPVRGSNDFLGIAGAARFQVTDKIAISPRLEYYYDKDGFITGTAQKLKEFTLTGEYKFNDSVLSRLEYRRDWSDQRVFERGATPLATKNQDTVLIGIVAYFGPKR